MEKSIFIALILFSTSFCFSQNSEIQVENITSTTSTSKSVTVTPKSRLTEEVTGTRPKEPNLDSLPMMPYMPSNGDMDKKTSTDKNTSKPH